MTILFLCPSFYPKIGGVEKHTFEVAKILARKNKVIVITEDKKNSHKKIKNIEIYRLNFGKTGWFKKFIIWLKLFRKIRIFEKADVIHCHDVFIWYLPLMFLLPKKKVFTTFHGYEGVYPPTFKIRLIRKLTEKLSEGNICVGEYIKNWYGTRPNFITYGGINRIKIKKEKTKRISSKLKILFIGRIERDTGIETYSKALEKLKNYSFEAIGDGSLREKFEKFGKVHGFVRDINHFLKNSDIVFASSYLSILESLNFKKSVFAVYENHLKKDYLKNTPFSKFIEISNSDKDLIKKINQFKKDTSDSKNKAEKGYRWVGKETWYKVAKLYLGLYGL